MPHPLRFGLKASGQWITIEQLRAIWKIADEAGFDHLWDFDHLASIGPTTSDAIRKHGRQPDIESSTASIQALHDAVVHAESRRRGEKPSPRLGGSA